MANLNEILSVMRAPVNVDVDPMGSFLDAREAQRRYENMGSQDQRAQAFLKIQQAQEARAAAEQQRQIEAVAAKKALDEKMKQQALTEQLARLKAAGYSDEEIQARAKLWGVPLESGPAPSLGVMGGLMPQAPAPEADISWADMAAGPQGGQAMGDAERAQLESQVFGAPLAAPVMPPAQPSVSDQELLGAMPRRPARVPPRQLGVMGGLGGGDQQAVLEAIGAPEPMQAPAQPMQAAQPDQVSQTPGRAPLMFNGISLEDLQPRSTTSDFVEEVRKEMPQYVHQAEVAESVVNRGVLVGDVPLDKAHTTMAKVLDTLIKADTELQKIDAKKKLKGGGGGALDPKARLARIRMRPDSMEFARTFGKVGKDVIAAAKGFDPFVIKKVKGVMFQVSQARSSFNANDDVGLIKALARLNDERLTNTDYSQQVEGLSKGLGLEWDVRKTFGLEADDGSVTYNGKEYKSGSFLPAPARAKLQKMLDVYEEAARAKLSAIGDMAKKRAGEMAYKLNPTLLDPENPDDASYVDGLAEAAVGNYVMGETKFREELSSEEELSPEDEEAVKAMESY